MRSRPKIKLLLSPSFVTPDSRLLAETVLVAKTETPIDFVSMILRCNAFTAAGAGKARTDQTTTLYQREWRSPKGLLTPGEHRYRVAFDLPATLPATYSGTDAIIDYAVRVHVAIPWWPDRIETFTVPVAPAESSAPPPARPESFATSAKGPRGTKPFMEVALENTHLSAGEVLTGSVSLQNLRGKRIRGIEVAIVEEEHVAIPTREVREGRRYSLRVHDGTPAEGEPIPFAVRLPNGATPTFRTKPFGVTTHVEVRAIVVWGEDVIVRPPLVVVPRASAPRSNRSGRGWVAPVGRERRALVWERAALRSALTIDSASERMFGARGPIAIEIRTEQRDADFWLVAKLGWPSLGLDLDIGEKKWTDVLTLAPLTPALVKSGDAKADARLRIHAREHAQAQAVIDVDLTEALLRFEEIQVDDATATLATRGSAHATAPVETFAASVLFAADAFAAAALRVPAPLLFDPHVTAWRAFADRLRGRLELGRMHVHDGAVGSDRVSVGTEWTRNGVIVGTHIRVVIDPPLDAPPRAADDPANSPAARDLWRELAAGLAADPQAGRTVGAVRAVRIERDALVVELEGKLADPAAALPLVELAVALRRALAGIKGSGPFR